MTCLTHRAGPRRTSLRLLQWLCHLMRKSATCRLRIVLLFLGLRFATVKDRPPETGHVSASPRLAAHQSGRAIGVVS